MTMILPTLTDLIFANSDGHFFADSDGHVFAGSYGLYGIFKEESYGYGIYNNLSQLDSTHPFGRMKIGLTFYHRLAFPDIYHCEEHLTP